jgi:methionyl aminopeptidase
VVDAQQKQVSKKGKVQEVLDKYRTAGRISVKAKKLAKKICKPGIKAYDICEKVEALIIKEGARPAFPCNLSINHEAAHYSAEILDKRVIPENSIVKIDLGAQIDGYIVDTAITINHNPQLEKLSQASKDALDAAIELIKPGVKVVTLGKRIEEVITEAGYQPVRNLSGHQIKRNMLHAGVTIPNCGPKFYEGRSPKLEAGRIYALEPFASTGEGWIHNGRTTNIFRYVRNPGKKNSNLESIASLVKKKVGILPFSPRHLHNKSTGKKGKEDVKQTIRKLLRANVLMGYPVLEENSQEIMVSQYEDTVRVTSSGCEILTRL